MSDHGQRENKVKVTDEHIEPNEADFSDTPEPADIGILHTVPLNRGDDRSGDDRSDDEGGSSFVLEEDSKHTVPTRPLTRPRVVTITLPKTDNNDDLLILENQGQKLPSDYLLLLDQKAAKKNLGAQAEVEVLHGNAVLDENQQASVLQDDFSPFHDQNPYQPDAKHAPNNSGPVCFIAREIDGEELATQFVNLYRAVGAGLLIALAKDNDLYKKYESKSEVGFTTALNNLVALAKYRKKIMSATQVNLLEAWKENKAKAERKQPEDVNSPLSPQVQKISVYPPVVAEAFGICFKKEFADDNAIQDMSIEHKVQLHAMALYLNKKEQGRIVFLKALSEVVNYGFDILEPTYANENGKGDHIKDAISKIKSFEQLNALLLNIKLRELGISSEKHINAFWEGVAIHYLEKDSTLAEKYQTFFSKPREFVGPFQNGSRPRFASITQLPQDVKNSQVFHGEQAYTAKGFLSGYQSPPNEEYEQYHRRQLRVLAQRGCMGEYSPEGVHEALFQNEQENWVYNHLNPNPAQKPISVDPKPKLSRRPLIVAGMLLTFFVFSITLFPMFAPLLGASWAFMGVIRLIAPFMIFGLSAFIANGMRQKLQPEPENNLEATFARMSGVEEMIYVDHEHKHFKHPSQLTLAEKEKLLDFLQYTIALLEKNRKEIEAIEADKYPYKGWLNSLKIMAFVLASERDVNRVLKVNIEGASEQDLTEKFAHAYRHLPDIIEKLKNTTVKPKTSWLGYGSSVFLAGFFLVLTITFALLAGNVALVTNFLFYGMITQSYTTGSTDSIISEFVTWFTPVLAVFGGLSIAGFAFFMGEARKSLPFKNYQKYRSNNANEIRRLESQNMGSYTYDPSPSNAFAPQLTVSQRILSGLVSGLTLGLVKCKWDPKLSFIFLGKWSSKGKHPVSDAGRQVFKAIFHAAGGALLVLALLYTPLGFGLALGLTPTVLLVYFGGAVLNTFFNALGLQNTRAGLPLKPWQGAWNEIAEYGESHVTGFTLGMLAYSPKLARGEEHKKKPKAYQFVSFIAGMLGSGMLFASAVLFITGAPSALFLLIAGGLMTMVGMMSLRMMPGWRFNLDGRQLLGYAGLITFFVGAGLFIAGGFVPTLASIFPLVVGGAITIARLGGITSFAIFNDREDVRIRHLRNFIRLSIFCTVALLFVLLSPQVALIGFGIQVSATWLLLTVVMMGIVLPLLKLLYMRLNAPLSESDSLKLHGVSKSVLTPETSRTPDSKDHPSVSVRELSRDGSKSENHNAELRLQQIRTAGLGVGDMGEEDSQRISPNGSTPPIPSRESSFGGNVDDVTLIMNAGWVSSIAAAPILMQNTREEIIARAVKRKVEAELELLVKKDAGALSEKETREKHALEVINKNPDIYYPKIAQEIARSPFWDTDEGKTALTLAADPKKPELIFRVEQILPVFNRIKDQAAADTPAQPKAKNRERKQSEPRNPPPPLPNPVTSSVPAGGSSDIPPPPPPSPPPPVIPDKEVDVKAHSPEDQAVLKLVDQLREGHLVLNLRDADHEIVNTEAWSALCIVLSKTQLYKETVGLYRTLYMSKLNIKTLTQNDSNIKTVNEHIAKIKKNSEGIWSKYGLKDLFVPSDQNSKDWVEFWKSLIFCVPEVSASVIEDLLPILKTERDQQLFAEIYEGLLEKPFPDFETVTVIGSPNAFFRVPPPPPPDDTMPVPPPPPPESEVLGAAPN